MSRPPYSFYHDNKDEIDKQVARRVEKPMAEPFEGALAVGFMTGLVAMFTLIIADSNLSDHRREGVMTIVSVVCGGVTYLALRAQRRAYWRIVEEITADLWENQPDRLRRTCGLEAP